MSAVMAALGSMASNLMQSQLNENAAQNADRRNVRNWYEQAAYNSPENQRQRLRQAGINPALAMQNGAMDSGSMSSPMHLANVPSYDFSPTSQALMQSADLHQQKRLQDSQIAQNEQLAENQRIRNKTQFFHDMAEILDKLSDKGLKDSERGYYEWLAKNMQKDYEWYDRKADVQISLQESQKNAEQAHADYLEAQKEYQNILNQFEPEKQKIIVRNLEKQGREIESAIVRNNAAAAHDMALKALTDAQKDGVDMDNDIKESMADFIVDEQAAKADEQYWKSETSAKKYYKGDFFGSKITSYTADNEPIYFNDRGNVRYHVKWNRHKKKQSSKQVEIQY